jgi:DNA mismatch repair protein MutS
MCGVPIERADDYLNRLIALGHRVAVCEQLEDPAAAKKRGAKSVVKRDVVRLVRPGTITEERLLEPGRARLLTAVQKLRSSEGRQVYGLAALDLSTGAVALSETDETGLAAEIARVEQSEVVASQAVYDEHLFSQIVGAMRVPATPLAREGVMVRRLSAGSPSSMASPAAISRINELFRKDFEPCLTMKWCSQIR